VKLAAIPVTPATPDPTGALLRYVDLSDVHVAAARRAILPSWLPSVATGRTDKGPRTVPLVAAGNTRQGRIAILTFDLQQSDWPLRISFPIAVQNLIHYLVPPPLVDRVTVPVGQQVDIAIRDGVREVDVSLPGGTVERLQLPLAPFGATAEPGLYTVREVSGRSRTTATFAVNFLSPRPAPTSGPPDVLLGNHGSQSARVVSQPIQVSWVFGLLALGILCAEWWFALRR
jgi:hypothetical protein